jgi:hypothetical protein
MTETLTYDQFLDLLRARIADADAIKTGELHNFSDLMSDYADVIPETWYWMAFEEMDAEGHLHPESSKLSGGDACARLSADGHRHLRAVGDADAAD